MPERFNNKRDDNESKYYNWQKVLSYDADVTMVVGARGIGKTYGIRLQCIRDYIKKGYHFVEICRFKKELNGVVNGYFDRIDINEEFNGYVFKTQGNKAYIAKYTMTGDAKTDKEALKDKWELLGYFCALSESQELKKRTFVNVKRIIFDEAILDSKDRFHRYLKNEFSLLANIVDTVSRERADDDSISPRLYLLGNALDIFNPYFERYGVNKIPKEGINRYNGLVLDYVQNNEYAIEKMQNTVAGRMLAGTKTAQINAMNKFSQDNMEFIAKKPSTARFYFGMNYRNKLMGVWYDVPSEKYYICDKVPKNTYLPIYAITINDVEINYRVAKLADYNMKVVTDAFYYGDVRFTKMLYMNLFFEIMRLFGVRS